MNKERDKLYSMFSSKLAIRWPNSDYKTYADKQRTSVNLFRVLFRYLSEATSYLHHLEKDASYGLIEKRCCKICISMYR